MISDWAATLNLYLRRPSWYHSNGAPMVNYIVLYKIRKRVKRILKDKISDGELATTKTSCLGCLADDISWEIYYLMKEKEEEDQDS
jgi:hypothetical protein